MSQPGGEMPAFPRPLPKTDGAAAPYWQALAQGRLALPRCRACGRLIFYPRSFCPACLSRDVAWETVPGEGRVYTLTVVRRATNPWFMDKTPYVYAVVELDAGPRLPTRLVDCAPEAVSVGLRVVPSFERVDDSTTLLHFRPAV
jgi:uncharacterized OB-fold protein